jgi:methyltransferase family protein
MRMTRLVVSFNRHFFALALLACAAGLGLIAVLDSPPLQVLVALGIGLAVYFMVASVVASYFIYDASDLYKMKSWPARCLPKPPGDGVVVHAGFDPASPAVQARFPRMRLRVFDFFDPRQTTEASIQRAHRLTPSASSEQISASSWPVPTASQDVVFALSAAHELREAEERAAFFREAKRVLRAEGRVIVIEQLRGLANFACFGLAAFHFMSRRTWLKSFTQAKLTILDEFRITPFMRAFLLRS